MTRAFRDFAASSVDAARGVASTPLVVAGVSQGGVIAQESADQDGVIGVIGISTTRDSAPQDETESMNHLLAVWGEDGPGEDLATMIASGSSNGAEPSASLTREAVATFPLHRLEHSIRYCWNVAEDRHSASRPGSSTGPQIGRTVTMPWWTMVSIS
ncbi:hypothetical protein [Corynebacterium sp.]|uniref:hypothetical protein n=1 Tax=Corynebacterium sp. TaxID=1720 RepID=UPI0028A9F86F|nr:hypothetical protein [Corynebacterium sp.]